MLRGEGKSQKITLKISRRYSAALFRRPAVDEREAEQSGNSRMRRGGASDLPPLKVKRGATSRLAGDDEIDGLWSFALFVGLDLKSDALAFHQ